jgi:hypothetical protein
MAYLTGLAKATTTADVRPLASRGDRVRRGGLAICFHRLTSRFPSLTDLEIGAQLMRATRIRLARSARRQRHGLQVERGSAS